MAQDNLKPWRPGDPVAASRLNAMQDRPITDIRVGAGLKMVRNGNAVSIFCTLPIGGGVSGLWAKVTSNDDGDPCKHAWTEQQATAAGGWSDATDGRTGTLTDTPLVAADGSKLDDGTVVWAIPVTADDGTPQMRAIVGGDPLPPGGLQYQVLTKATNADGDVAWDWVRAHA